jgi:hypothetical protein
MRLKATAMARKRQPWIKDMRNALSGMVGEYTKYRIAKLLDQKDYWSNEVKRLLKSGPVRLLDEKQVTTDGKWDRDEALLEAVQDASTSQAQLTAAKNEYASSMLSSPKERKAFLRKWNTQNWDVADLLIEMMEEFCPEVSKRLQTAAES